ncbi:MAG: hypothetical protein WBD40_10180 [Tepidisphaeraceae bacterium]
MRGCSRKWMGSWVVIVGLTALVAGCFETETPLGPVEQGVVDKRLVGEWTIRGEGGAGEGGGDSIDLTVRNFNGREFYVELREPNRPAVRYAAYVIEVKGAPFVHLRELTDDGEVATKHLVMRVDRVDDRTINLRNLNEAFFADKPHETTAQLRAIIEKNLEGPAMYAGEPLVMNRRKAE